MELDVGLIASRLVRAFAASAIALAAVGCRSGPCDNPYASVQLHVAGGQSSISSYQVSGACTGAGTAADCHTELCGRGAIVCACDIPVPMRLSAPQPASTTACHIEVTSTEGRVFAVDVAIIVRPGPCPDVLLADPDHPIITVDFASGSPDGGAAP